MFVCDDPNIHQLLLGIEYGGKYIWTQITFRSLTRQRSGISFKWTISLIRREDIWVRGSTRERLSDRLLQLCSTFRRFSSVRASERVTQCKMPKKQGLFIQRWNEGSDSAFLSAALLKWGAHLHKNVPPQKKRSHSLGLEWGTFSTSQEDRGKPVKSRVWAKCCGDINDRCDEIIIRRKLPHRSWGSSSGEPEHFGSVRGRRNDGETEFVSPDWDQDGFRKHCLSVFWH